MDFHDQEYLIASWRYRYCGNDLDTTDNFPSFRDWTFNPTEDSNQCEGILYHANRTGVERPVNEPITDLRTDYEYDRPEGAVITRMRAHNPSLNSWELPSRLHVISHGRRMHE